MPQLPTTQPADRVLVAADTLQRRLAEVAAQIRATLDGAEIHLVGLANGGLPLTVDLLRELERSGQPCSVSVLSPNKMALHAADDRPVRRPRPCAVCVDSLHTRARHFLIVDDIHDLGETAELTRQALAARFGEQVASIRVCVAIYRQRPDKRTPPPEFALVTTADDHFLYGYGMDLLGLHRGLCEIRIHPQGAPMPDA